MADLPLGRPNLVFALVGAAGTDLGAIKTQLKAQLASFEYKFQEIKLSQHIAGLCKVETKGLPEDERITALMDGGDTIRSMTGKGDGVAYLAIAAIRRLRSLMEEKAGQSPAGIAFVIDSLKNPEEIKTLRRVYGENFYVISVYSSSPGEQDRNFLPIDGPAGT